MDPKILLLTPVFILYHHISHIHSIVCVCGCVCVPPNLIGWGWSSVCLLLAVTQMNINHSVFSGTNLSAEGLFGLHTWLFALLARCMSESVQKFLDPCRRMVRSLCFPSLRDFELLFKFSLCDILDQILFLWYFWIYEERRAAHEHHVDSLHCWTNMKNVCLSFSGGWNTSRCFSAWCPTWP